MLTYSSRNKIKMNDIMANNADVERMESCTINDICRLCANLDDNMVPIYADEGADHMLENKIKTHLPFINICKNDLLPKRICYHCASAVLVWNELYECSSNADLKLRSMFEASPYDQDQCKNVSYADIEGIPVPEKDFIGSSIEYEEITDVNMFSKNEKSDKTLNELDKIPGTSKTDNILNHEDKSSVIEDDERLNTSLKRYTLLTESDATFKIITSKDTSLSNNYSCSFCPAEFLKIRDKVKHDRDVHGVQSNILPIKFVSDRYLESLKIEDDEKNNTVSNIIDISNTKKNQVFEKNNCDIQSTVCNISFETTSEKIEHDNKLHDMMVSTQQSIHSVVSTSYDEIQNGNLNVDIETKNIPLNSKQDTIICFKSETTEEKINIDLNLNFELNKIKDEHIETNVQKDFKCYYCNKQFTSKNLASKHVRTHMNMLDIKKPVTKSDVFDKYKVMIDNKLYYKCDQCNYAVEGRRYKFVYHMRVHTGEKPYKCEICNKQFRTAAFLRRHIVCFHERVRGYQCDICGRSFSEKRNVDDHRRTHTGERPFVCETCGKSFAQRSSMKIHWKQMHESIKSHKCQYCEKSFIRRCHLVAHLTHHTGVRNYVCAVCGKAFLRSGTLKGHTAVHSSERPFRCTICGDSFKLKKHLKQHGRVHGNQLAFGSVPQLDLISTDNDQLGSQ